MTYMTLFAPQPFAEKAHLLRRISYESECQDLEKDIDNGK